MTWLPTITVWTDGSGTTGGPAGIGYVAVSGAVVTEGSLQLKNATNQQAELLAAAYALHNLPAGSDVVVVSDSEYVVLGWNDPTRKRRKNLEHWARLTDAAGRHRRVRFEWVKGHDGAVHNERADRLAVAARAQAKAAAA